MKLSRNQLIIAAVIAVGGGALAYRTYIAPRAEQYATVEVRRGNVREEVSETGRVVPAKEFDLFFKNGGRVAALLVAEGEGVNADQPILRLDTKELGIKEREASALLSQASAKYQQALAGTPDEEVRIYETALENAERDLEKVRASAEVKIANLYEAARLAILSGSATATTGLTDMDNILGIDDKRVNDAFEDKLGQLDLQKKVDAEAAYHQASLSVKASADASGRLSAASPSGEVDAAVVLLRTALGDVMDALAAVKAMLDATTTGTGFTVADLTAKKTLMNTDRSSAATSLSSLETADQNIRAAEAANAREIAAAEGTAQSARDALSAKRAPIRDVDKAVYEAAVVAARASLDLIRQQIDDATLRAPMDGVVSNIDVEKGELVTPTVRAGAMISSALELQVDVSELDIRKIAVGSPMAATFDAVGETLFTGKVAEVAAREKLRDEDIFYQVTARLDQADERLKPGMTADISFLIAEKADVLVVPERLIIKKGGKTSVRLLKGGRPEEVPVTLGLRGIEFVEIADGLEEGDKLIAGLKE
jgi:HlyD family secretion protein